MVLPVLRCQSSTEVSRNITEFCKLYLIHSFKVFPPKKRHMTTNALLSLKQKELIHKLLQKYWTHFSPEDTTKAKKSHYNVN